MKVLKLIDPIDDRLKDYEMISLSSDIFNENSPRYAMKDKNSWFNVENENSIFNTDEIYIVYSMKDIFDYIRKLEPTYGMEYSIGANNLYWNSAKDMRLVYCKNAKFFFIEGQLPNGNKSDEIYLRRRFEILNTEDLNSFPKMGSYRYVDLTMVRPYFEYYGKLVDAGKACNIGFDFETNAMPLEDYFYITGFSLSTQQMSTWFDFRYPLDASEEVRKDAYAAFKEFLDKYDTHLWTYNVQFEMSVCMQLFNKRYEFQDTRAMFVCDGYNWGSLKLNAQKLLNVRGWSDTGERHRELTNIVMHGLKNPKGAVLFPGFKDYDEMMNYINNIYPTDDATSLIHKTIAELIEMKSDWNLFKKYWGFEWAVIPTPILGYYCCLDSFYTVKCAERLLPKYKESYRTYANNARLGGELGYKGIRINYDRLKKVEKNLNHLINSGRIFLDQFVLQGRMMKYKNLTRDYEFSPRMIRGISKFGMMILDPNLGKYYIGKHSASEAINFNEDLASDTFDGNDEYITKLRDIFLPYNGVSTRAYSRKRNFISAVHNLLIDYFEVNKSRTDYNKRYNFNNDFEDVKNYLLNYREVNCKKYFGDHTKYIDWDKYKDLYDKALSLKMIDAVGLSECKVFTKCDNNIDTKKLVDAIRENPTKLKFHEKPTYNESEWENTNEFCNYVARVLNTPDDHKSELNKLFTNFTDEVQYKNYQIEYSKYDDLELINFGLDHPDKVTYDGQKVDFDTFGGKQGNYGSPIMKDELAVITNNMFHNEYTWLRFMTGEWFDYKEGLPIPDDPEKVQKDESGKIIKVCYKLTYDQHINYINTNPVYAEFSESLWWKCCNLREALQSIFITESYEYPDFDATYIPLKFSYYDNKLKLAMALMYIYQCMSGAVKQMTGYITGSTQGIYSRIRMVGEERENCEIKTWDKDKCKYWAYYPHWMINEKSTKRWASGFHTFVPHSDSMSVFEVNKEPGEEEVAIYFDINAAELRSIAYSCRDEKAMGIFDAGKDFYLEVVKSAYPDKDPVFWKRQRKRWKSCVLGIFYGIGDVTIANTYGLSMDDVAFIRKTLMGDLHNIRKTIQQCEEYCKENGEIMTVMHDRMFGEWYRAHTVGFNMRIQGFSAVALADAFYNDTVMLNRCGYNTNVKVVVHDSNTIVVKVKDLFKVIFGIDKYYKGYFLRTYKLRYKYDLVLHVNLRDAIDFSFDMETLVCKISCMQGYDCDWLMNAIKKYYKIEMINEVDKPIENDTAFYALVRSWEWKSHRYYCDRDFKVPNQQIYEFKILNPIEELRGTVDNTDDSSIYFEDRTDMSHLLHTWKE